MKNAIILHGTSANPDKNWFPWLKKELEQKGYKVWVPQLPDADAPNVKKYNEFLLNNGFDFNEETALIGHSSGSMAILGLLQNLPGDIRIGTAILVGSFINDLGSDDLKGLFLEEFDWEKIKSRAERFIFFHSDNDPYCPLGHAEFLSKKLSGKLIVMKGQGHFNITSHPKYKEFPELLKELTGRGAKLP